MNKFIKIFLFFCSAVLLTACSSTQTITVKGLPNTKIYNSNFEYLGTIQNDGKAQIEFPRYIYRPFLLSHTEGSNTYIPFALDYKYKNYTGTCIFLSCTSLPLFEVPFLWYMGDRVDQVFNRYKYLPDQQTNQNLAFANYANKGLKRSIGNSSETGIANEERISGSAHETTTSKAKTRSSKSAKTFKDLSNLVEGIYIGSGKLLLNGKTIEKYTHIQVVLTKIDKYTVKAEVIESNGDSFFTSDNEYSIKKDGNRFTLTHRSIPSAIITFQKDNSLSYFHPKVNIDGDIYTLEISATKK